MSLINQMTRSIKPILLLVSAACLVSATLNMSFADRYVDELPCVTDFVLEFDGARNGNHTYREGLKTLGEFYLSPNFKTEQSVLEGGLYKAEVQVTLAGKERSGVRVFLLSEYSKGFWYNFIKERTFSVEEDLGLTDSHGLISLTLDLSEKRYLVFIDQDKCLKPVGLEVLLCEP